MNTSLPDKIYINQLFWEEQFQEKEKRGDETINNTKMTQTEDDPRQPQQPKGFSSSEELRDFVQKYREEKQHDGKKKDALGIKRSDPRHEKGNQNR